MYVSVFNEIIPDLYTLEKSIGSVEILKYYEKMIFENKNKTMKHKSSILGKSRADRRVEVIVAFEDGEVVGYMIFTKYSTRNIERHSKITMENRVRKINNTMISHITRVLCKTKEALEYIMNFLIINNLYYYHKRNKILMTNEINCIDEIKKILDSMIGIKEKKIKFKIFNQKKEICKVSLIDNHKEKLDKLRKENLHKYINYEMLNHRVSAVDKYSLTMYYVLKCLINEGISLDEIIKEKEYIIKLLNKNLIDKYRLINDVFTAKITYRIEQHVYKKIKKTGALETLKNKLMYDGYVKAANVHDAIEKKVYSDTSCNFYCREDKEFSFYVDPNITLGKYRTKFKKIVKFCNQKKLLDMESIYVYNRYGQIAYEYNGFQTNKFANKIKLIPYYNSKTFDNSINKLKFMEKIQKYIFKFYNENIHESYSEVLWKTKLILKEPTFTNCLNTLIARNTQIEELSEELDIVWYKNNINYLTRGALERLLYCKKKEKNLIYEQFCRLYELNESSKYKINQKRLRKVISKLIKKGDIAQIQYEIDCEIMRIQKII